MTGDAGAGADTARPATAPLVVAFVALVALTARELCRHRAGGRARGTHHRAGRAADGEGRPGAVVLHARAGEPARVVADAARDRALAAGVAVVLMLETVFRVNVH